MVVKIARKPSECLEIWRRFQRFSLGVPDVSFGDRPPVPSARASSWPKGHGGGRRPRRPPLPPRRRGKQRDGQRRQRGTGGGVWMKRRAEKQERASGWPERRASLTACEIASSERQQTAETVAFSDGAAVSGLFHRG